MTAPQWEGWEEDVRRIVREESQVAENPPPQPAADLTPAALGLAGFATTTFVLSIFLAGWLAQMAFIPLALFTGGLVQFLAGMWAFRDRDTFLAVVFSAYGGGFWISLAFFFLLQNLELATEENLGPALGFTLVSWTVFTTYMWISSAKVTSIVFTIFTVFMVLLILLDIGFLAGAALLITIGGYVGILLAVLAWYFSAGVVINFTFGRTVLPLGSPIGG